MTYLIWIQDNMDRMNNPANLEAIYYRTGMKSRVAEVKRTQAAERPNE
jgi:hypothetical protein